MKGRASRRAAWEDEDVDPIDWSQIRPNAGPRVFIITCEHCPWESPEVPTVAECKRLLVEHGYASHHQKIAQSIDVRARSGKHVFRIEQIEK